MVTKLHFTSNREDFETREGIGLKSGRICKPTDSWEEIIYRYRDKEVYVEYRHETHKFSDRPEEILIEHKYQTKFSELISELINTLQITKQRYNKIFDRLEFFSQFKEKLQKLWGMCKSKEGYAKRIVILIEDAIENLWAEDISKEQIDVLIKVLNILSDEHLTQEDARNCNRLLREVEFNTVVPLGDISKSYAL